MKSKLFLGLSLLFLFCPPSHAANQELMVTMDTYDNAATILGRFEFDGTDWIIKGLKIKIGLWKYRISSTSDFEFVRQLCGRYMNTHPILDYETVRDARFYEWVAHIDHLPVVHTDMKNNQILESVACRKKSR